ncbi:MAG: 3'(2'),5'-bisphosphate nucleotidase CysQ [Rickettsiales bacterium]|nr:3'(2'),5'-bisphosphate nucleotidase CysQ [Rickettsiales bacterium]
MSLSPQAQTVAAQLDALVEICEKAHQVILPYWRTELEIESKDDNSPVTKADKAANEVIEKALLALFPDIPVVSEEGTQEALAQDAIYWLVDPVDGTKSFIAGLDEFTVNIALIEQNKPVIGILGVPAQKKIYKAVAGQAAWKRHEGEEWQKIERAERPEDGLRVVTSRSHRSPKLTQWLDDNGVKVKEHIGAGSALKFGLVAEGLADLYVRIGPTMEWDTAAGHCLVEAAGGIMTDLEGQPFLYGKEGYLNGGFIVRGVR